MKSSDSAWPGMLAKAGAFANAVARPELPARWRGLLLLAFVCVLATQPARAQVLYGSLVGQVEDPSRAVLPGATVTVINRDTGLQRETTTDGSGSYAFQ